MEMNTRIPTSDDQFLIDNAHRMFKLLLEIESYPLGYALTSELVDKVQDFSNDCMKNGIDVIAVVEGSKYKETALSTYR